MTQLGDTLSEERRRQGKSIVDVEAATRIRGRLLEALEHGDYDQLPAPAYVKGYIQSYAKYLDIPAQPLLELYKVDVRFVDERAEERERMGPVLPRGARYSKASRQSLEDLPADTVVPRRDQQHAIPTQAWIAVAAGILAVFLVIWGISKLVASPQTPPPVPASVQETLTPSGAAAVTTEQAPVTPVSPDGGAVTPASSSATEGMTPYTLTFKIVEDHESSLKVTVDGEVQFDQIFSKAEEVPAFTVYQEAVIVIGEPRWVTTMKDGTRIPTPNQDDSYTLTIENDGADR